MDETLNLKGTLRTRRAEDTLARIQPTIRKAGITRLVNFTQLDSIGIPVYSCIRPLSKNLSTSQGKGITPSLAMCSAYMEAIETFFAENVPTDYELSAKRRAPYECIDLSLLQHGCFYTSNMKEKVREWTVIESLTSEKKYLIPTHYVKFDLSTPAIENSLFRKTTTGLASGNTEEEATCHALFEIIERNAKHQFDHSPTNRKTQQLIDLDSVDYPEAVFLIERLRENDIDILLFNLPNPFGYPTLSCLIGDQHPLRKLGTYSGSGTHVDAGIAACRAITEAIQSRLTYIAGSRDDILPSQYRIQWRPLTAKGTLDFKDIPSQPLRPISEQYNRLVQSFEERSFDILRHIHTTEEDPISVVKCVIPGLVI
jgi:ribosomal protein S12 methylthiotransferase accessory factor